MKVKQYFFIQISTLSTNLNTESNKDYRYLFEVVISSPSDSQSSLDPL